MFIYTVGEMRGPSRGNPVIRPMSVTKTRIVVLATLLAGVAGCGGTDPVSSQANSWVKDIKITTPSIRMTGPGVARAAVALSTGDTVLFAGQSDTTTVLISAQGPFSATWELGPFRWRVLNITASAPGTGSITVSAGGKSSTIDITAVALGFKTVAMANGYACGIVLDDTAWCWGGNWAGELGTTTVGQCSGSACQYGGNNGNATPLPVNGDRKFAQIATSGYLCTNGFVGGTCGKTCALTSAAELWCWGDRVGTEPTAVAPGLIFTALSIRPSVSTDKSTATAESCGLAADKTAYCFTTTTTTPIGNGMTFSALSVGSRHSCAVDLGGDAYCWGDNRYGQLGIGSADTATHANPERVAGTTKFKAVNVGQFSTCALGTDDAIYCWGLGYAADGVSPPPSCNGMLCESSPRPVEGSRRYSSFSSSLSYVCGLAPDGSVDCWSAFNRAPSVIALPEAVTTVSVGPVPPAAGCAVSVTHIAYCWSTTGVVTKIGQ